MVESYPYFEVPEGAKLLLKEIEKDENENFHLPLIAKRQITHDTWELDYGFPE